MWPLPAAESAVNPDPGWASCQFPPSEQGTVRVWSGRSLHHLSVTSFERGSQCSDTFWRSIGVTLNNRLTVSQTREKASSLAGCARKSVASSSREVILSAQIWWDIWSVGSSSVHLGTRDTDLLKSVQQKAMMKRQSSCCMRRGWEIWDCSSWRRFRKDLTNIYKYMMEGEWKPPDSSLWCLAAGWETMGISWNTGESIYKSENPFPVRVVSGADCPAGFWSLLQNPRWP